EEELDKKLFRRSRASMNLTDEGMLLLQRAEDIVSMVDKTVSEFKSLDDITGGDIYIGCAESYQIRYIAHAVQTFQKQYPGVRYHLTSGNTEQVAERLNRGQLDFALICESPDLSKYNYIEIPIPDVWGLVMRRDNKLAKKKSIRYEDLLGLPLICSIQAIYTDFPRWCGDKVDKLNIFTTLNLFYNGSVFVKEGLGVMLVFDHLADTSEGSELCFRPLEPRLETKMYIIWKKHQQFTPISSLFMEELKETLRL
ncbi:MAG: LysR family transcriptional regulator, partial [Proteobacteria bacterium]|nr:LysR family transcriptional regulator [Pseudomonadota bacterium]